MSQDRITAQLKGLQHPSPFFRRQAAYGVFALLQGTPAVQPDSLQDVLLTCLTNQHPVRPMDGSKFQLLNGSVKKGQI